MSTLHFLFLLLVAGICGSLGKMLGGFSRDGWLVSIGLGVVVHRFYKVGYPPGILYILIG